MVSHIITNTKETKYGRIRRHDNGLVYFYFHDGISVCLEDARQIVELIRSLDDSGQARLLIVQGNSNDLTFEAQRYLGTINVLTHLALVTRGCLQAEVAQFFMGLLRILRSPYEMQTFYQVEAAEDWLLSARN